VSKQQKQLVSDNELMTKFTSNSLQIFSHKAVDKKVLKTTAEISYGTAHKWLRAAVRSRQGHRRPGKAVNAQ